jgi:predicted RecB family endonuclease
LHLIYARPAQEELRAMAENFGPENFRALQERLAAGAEELAAAREALRRSQTAQVRPESDL